MWHYDFSVRYNGHSDSIFIINTNLHIDVCLEYIIPEFLNDNWRGK